MTLEEFMKIVKVLKSAYTNEKFLPDADAVKVWYHSLKDIPYQLLQVATYKYITTNKYPPAISELRSQAVSVTTNERGWGDGWQQVLKAISKYGQYNERKALDYMDEKTRMAVKSIGFKNICLSENLAVERANFRMVYESIEQKQREEQLIPDNVREKIAQLTSSMKQIKGE